MTMTRPAGSMMVLPAAVRDEAVEALNDALWRLEHAGETVRRAGGCRQPVDDAAGAVRRTLGLLRAEPRPAPAPSTD